MGLILEHSLLENLCGCLLLFWLVYLYIVKDFGYWEEARVAHAAPTFPLGSLPRLVLGKWTWGEAFTDLYRRFPDEQSVGFFYVTEPCLLVRNPHVIKRILETDFDHFTDRVLVTVNRKDYLAQNLFNMGGEKWKKMKSKMTPAYTATKMEMMFYLVKSSSDNLLRAIEKLPREFKEIDSGDLLSRFILDIIVASSFGIEINSIENRNSKIYHFVKGLTSFTWKRMLKILALKSFPLFRKYHAFDFFDPEVRELLFETITRATKCREDKHVERCDFFGMMMKLRLNQSMLKEGEPTLSASTSDSSEGLTLEEITSEIHLFILKTQDSTLLTCQLGLYELARNKKIQEKLFAEVKTFQDLHVDLTYQSLQQMIFLDQVINEVLRLYPVVPVIMRNCTKTYEVPDSKLVIPKGMAVYVPVCGLHRDPDYFPNPDTFDPDRFSPENSKNINPFAFLPFGAGPRTCMGFRFGLMMVKSALASLVSRYVVELAPITPVPLAFKRTAFNASPDCPVRLRLIPRSPT